MGILSGERKPMSISLFVKFGYGLGHVLNDLCASLWFTYILIFYNYVEGFSSVNAGGLLLTGQIADALSTPTVGLLSDRGTCACALKYGKRKTWHLLGTLCVLGSVPFMYSPFYGCSYCEEWQRFIYYSVFIVIFQFGWASVQISHLSLVPDLTSSENERTSLLSIRNSFTVLSNLSVYLVTWSIFEMTGNGDEARLSPKDQYKFQDITIVICIVGAVASLIFHLSVKENVDEPLLQGEFAPMPRQRMSIGGLFSRYSLYQVAVVYMGTRLFCNVSQSLLALYLHDVLHLTAKSLAIIPFVMFLSSFLTSFTTGPLNKSCGRQIAFSLGCCIAIGGCIWVYFGSGHLYVTYFIYGIAILLGCANSILLVTSLSITADLIGNDTGNSAFVYGIMSFVDKLSCGIAIMIIQSLKPIGESNYYRDSLVYVCSGAALLGMVASFTLNIKKKDLTPESTLGNAAAPETA